MSNHNEAERMREGYERNQERHEQGGPTGAGGAGSTSTPGNTEKGGETTGKGNAGPGYQPTTDATVPTGGTGGKTGV